MLMSQWLRGGLDVVFVFAAGRKLCDVVSCGLEFGPVRINIIARAYLQISSTALVGKCLNRSGALGPPKTPEKHQNAFGLEFTVLDLSLYWISRYTLPR